MLYALPVISPFLGVGEGVGVLVGVAVGVTGVRHDPPEQIVQPSVAPEHWEDIEHELPHLGPAGVTPPQSTGQLVAFSKHGCPPL